ncbi:MAG TPA: SGNH/GDSL hydrolase family protein [Streptomyces sp.]|uniref:SGNH/GDSL hydrolase family protein n=1 Tax=Streptomyces sp. TaxID=1931 RepID=UPI002D46382A|nr:SGNH/GDSL hydrolase family protein [Streptomyces sp.]HZG04588.1 SGNH/GDSL hydrolase family protein [Streptomyces sp.]
MRGRTALTGLAGWLAAETAVHLLVRRLRPSFPWLIGDDDVAPDIDERLVARHASNSFDADLGWCRRPGQTGTERTRDGTTSYTIDPLGRRNNPGFEDVRSQVACFGDSFVFCRLVNDDQTWPHQLSRLLGTHAANYGIGNYGLDQALLRLERELPSLEAHVVVMGVVPETIARVHSYWKHYFEYGNTLAFKPRFVLDPAGRLHHHGPAVRTPAEYATYHRHLDRIQSLDHFFDAKFRRDLLRFPYLPRIARRFGRHGPILRHLVAGLVSGDHEHAFARAFDVVLRDNARWTAGLYRDPRALALLEALVARFAERCTAAGKQPVLLVMPQPVDLQRDGGAAYAQAFASMRRILPVIDVTPAFRDAPDHRALFAHGRLGPHPNHEGNALIAQAVARQIDHHITPQPKQNQP